jgi:hypothetical protein
MLLITPALIALASEQGLLRGEYSAAMIIDVQDSDRLAELLSALDDYRPARVRMLATLGLVSNRDPLSELGEQVAQAVLGGNLADSRVQAHYDLVTGDGQAVQVKYLANTTDSAWVNEHTVLRHEDVPLYALVIFEAFRLAGMVVVPTTRLAEVGAALGKAHPRQDDELQFTRRNWLAIRADVPKYEALGVRVWLPE